MASWATSLPICVGLSLMGAPAAAAPNTGGFDGRADQPASADNGIGPLGVFLTYAIAAPVAFFAMVGITQAVPGRGGRVVVAAPVFGGMLGAQTCAIGKLTTAGDGGCAAAIATDFVGALLMTAFGSTRMTAEGTTVDLPTVLVALLTPAAGVVAYNMAVEPPPPTIIVPARSSASAEGPVFPLFRTRF